MKRDARLVINGKLLRSRPLVDPSEGDKEGRGVVLVVGGSKTMPGAVILAAIAALRVGAGKLRIATCKSASAAVATAIPEARVFAVAETRDGEISVRAASDIVRYGKGADAVLIGPGMSGNVDGLMRAVATKLRDVPLVLDSEAMMFLRRHKKAGSNVVLTPHAGEFAKLRNVDKARVKRAAPTLAARGARELGCVVALKGAETNVAAADGETYVNRAGNVGLATSGSGDTLAGVIVGLLARGSSPLDATLWGVHLHASAGDEVARRIAPLGYLARELLDVLPRVMDRLSRSRSNRSSS